MFHRTGDDQGQIPIERFHFRVSVFSRRNVGGHRFANPRTGNSHLEAVLPAVIGFRVVERFKFAATDLIDHTVNTRPVGPDQSGFARTVFTYFREFKPELISGGICKIPR